MSAPVLLSVVLSMQTALQAITRAGGYFYDVKTTSVRTKPEPMLPIDPNETPLILLGHKLEPVSRDFAGSRPVSLKERWRITLDVRVDTISDDLVGGLTAFTNLAADIEKALTVDITANREIWSGTPHVLYVYVMQPIPQFGLIPQGQVYFEQPVEVLFQRTYTQP
jgi:hypothetical protein